MSITEYTLLFAAVLVGGSIALYFRKVSSRHLGLVLSFSGAYLLGIAMLHLMPVAFAGSAHSPGLWILVGFFVQLLLEQLSSGVEHGHMHHHHLPGKAYMLQMMLGLCLHAFFEGLPLGNYEAFQALDHGHVHSDDHLLMGSSFTKRPRPLLWRPCCWPADIEG